MADQLIDEIISEAAFKQVEKIQSNMAELMKTFESTAESAGALDQKLKGSKGGELDKALKESIKNQKELEKIAQQLEKTNREKIATEKALEALTQAKLKSEADAIRLMNLKNKESDKAAKAAKAESDAYEQLKKQYKEVSDEAKRLSAQYGLGSKESEKATKKAKELHDQLLAIEKSVGQNQRNVGNYAGSAKIIVEAFERSRVKLAQVEKQFNATSPEAKEARGEFEALNRITANPKFLNISANIGDTNAELKFFTKQLNQLEDAGLKNSAVYKDIQERLAALTDQLGDTRAEIKALSSDTRGFDLFAGAVNFAADAFQTAAGAAVLFGASEEDAAEATRTLVAVQSISNGIKGIANELTTKGTAANKAFTFVQLQMKVAMDATATSAARLRAVLITAGIGALIIGVGLLIANFGKLKDFLSGTTRESERLAESQKRLTDFNSQVIESVAKESSQLKILRAKIEDTNLPMRTRIANVKDLQELYPEFFKDLKQEDILNGNAAAAYDLAAAAILRKAKAMAASKKIEELSQKELDIDKENEDDFKKTSLAIANATKRTKFVGKAEIEETVKTKEQVQAELAKDFAKRQQIRLADKKSLQADLDFYLLTVTKNTDLTIDQRKREEEEAKKLEEERKKRQKENNDKGDRNLKAILDSKKIDLEARAQVQKEILQIETFSFEERQKALMEYVRIKQQIITAETNFELSKKGLTAGEIELIEKQKNQKIADLNKEALSLFTITAKDAVEKVADEAIEITDEAADAMNRIGEQMISQIEDFLERNKSLTDELKESYRSLGDQIKQTFADVIGGIFDRQKNKIQEQINEIEKRKLVEIKAAETSVGTEQEKSARIASIENKAQAEKEVLAQKQRKVDTDKARFEKLFKAFNIGSSTIESVAKIKATIAELTAKAAANPFLLPLIPVAAAQLPITIAIGAAQLASLLAIPLPKYAGGRDGGKAEFAIVGEAGPERVETNSGSYMVNNPSIAYLPENAKVVSNPELVKESLRKAAVSSMYVNSSGQLVQQNADIEHALEKHADRIIQAYKDNRTTINVTRTWKGDEISMEKVSAYNKWVNDNVRL
ncbi:MAG TPA: hypothetical protein VF487_20290 [Chitinophagaceae bacterium]